MEAYLTTDKEELNGKTFDIITTDGDIITFKLEYGPSWQEATVRGTTNEVPVS